MLYYLDTNICIEYLRGRNERLYSKINSHAFEVIKIPLLVVGELMHGVFKSNKQQEGIEQVSDLLVKFEIVYPDLNEAIIYGQIRTYLERQGQVIGSNDLLIAAAVLSRNGTLVTNNTREFSRIEGLMLEDWTR